MLQTEELYYLQYIMLFPAEWRCPLSDHYMKAADGECGRAFVLKADEKPVAYAVLSRENQGWILEYIYTDKNERGKGFAAFLIRDIIMRSEKYLRVHILQSHPYYKEMTACLNKLGFVVNDVSCVFSAEVGEKMWARMDELNLVRMKELLLGDGSECIPFRNMDDSIRNQLISSPSSEFSNSLDPAPLLKNSAYKVDHGISTALVKNGRLKAYTLVTRPSHNSVTVEQIAESQDELGSGRVVAPLCTTLEAVRSIPEITVMKMTISDRNKKSYKLVTRILKAENLDTTKNMSFIITKELLKRNR